MTLVGWIPGPSVVVREGGQERWCFRCRKRTAHRWELMDDPPERQPSYYDPTWRCRCTRCNGDYTTFPGWEPVSWAGPPPEVETRPTGRNPFAEMAKANPDWAKSL